jgi:hypothetical protein
MLVLGIGLVVLAAVGATSTQRSLEADGRASIAPLYLVPFGVLLGAGAAIARGFDLVAAMVVGAVLVPVVGVVGRMVEVRRHRRRTNREG